MPLIARIRRSLRRWTWRLVVVLLIAIAVIYVALRWPQRWPTYKSEFGPQLQFERVADAGFDLDGQLRKADSAWSMRYFQPEGAETGYVYVGTDNNIVGLTLSIMRQRKSPEVLPVKPPQIRRYRSDLLIPYWEVVLDCADHENLPYHTQGFRTMAVYRALADGQTYLYAGTMAEHSPAVWRSASGDPGSWEVAFVFPESAGSIRGMVTHKDGLLYMSTTPPDDISPGGIGHIWATDGVTFTHVVTDGFGNPDNAAISMLASYQDCLYAGTYNPVSGYEVWKLRCVDAPDKPPRPVIQEGGGQPQDEAVMSMRVFQDHLYIGSGIPMGFNPFTRHGPRGCSLLRLDAEGNWDVIIGKRRRDPLSGYKGGFGWHLNAYCWYMQEHDNYLYLGTWDLSRTLVFLGEQAEATRPAFRPLLKELVAGPHAWGSPVGGDLYRTPDGVRWEPVFLDGLGNPDNHGIRTMESTPLGFFVGTENPFTRLEVWRLLE